MHRASGRAQAQQEELNNLRKHNQTMTDDVRMSTIRGQFANTGAGEKMAIMQFASTLKGSMSAMQDPGAGAVIDAVCAATAPSAGEGSGQAAQIAYGGEEAAAQWKREEKERKKEKKEKRKAKKQKRKEKKKAKITQLMEEKGKSFEEAINMVEDVYSESDSDSESD